MMAGNPNWWNMHPPSSTTSLFPPHVLANNGSSSVIPLNYLPDHHHHHHHVQDPPPQSWSQLLLSGNNTTGLSEDDTEDRFGQNQIQHKKLQNWEDHHQMISSTRTNNLPPRLPLHSIVDHHDHHDHNHVKQETKMDISYQKSSNNLLYGQAEHEIEILNRPNICANNWSQVILPAAAAAAAVSSSSISRSCITSTSLGSTTADNINILDFSCNKPDIHNLARNQTTDHTTSSECNSTATGGALSKKARVQSSSQPPLKVRKERLGDRITALHQLVSPFGKTDTASVLLEAIGYIRFLQSQIEALSSPYLGHASKNMRNQTYDMERQEKQKDLRSRGLCLVPVSCTQHVGSDNGADYWAPANYSSGF